MTVNPYQEFVLPTVRAVVKLYSAMTPEQEASLKRDNHLLFYNVLHMKRALEAVDESRADLIKQRDALNRALGETGDAPDQEQAEPTVRGVQLIWHEGYGYRCPRCKMFVTHSKRYEPLYCTRCT